MSLLTPLVNGYKYSLAPIAPFTWFGLGISTLDLVAAFRLCIALRQIREVYHQQHVAKEGKLHIEKKSFVRDASATLLVVYGGEAVVAPLLGIPPSFMLSGVVPGLYTAIQAIVELLPAVPTPSLTTELPLAILDGFTRALLLCTLIPPVVLTHAAPAIATSPWTLLLSSLIAANGGFFLTNLLGFFAPGPLRVTTPPELLPYGWTTTDLWCAPLVTGLFALLTHAQPFWADAHALAAEFLGVALGEASVGEKGVQPLDPETARAVCGMLLASMFVTRALKNFGGASVKRAPIAKKISKSSKTKTQ